jgi:hypothetical protein
MTDWNGRIPLELALYFVAIGQVRNDGLNGGIPLKLALYSVAIGQAPNDGLMGPIY